MATVAVFRYFEEVFTQPSFYETVQSNLWGNVSAVNNSFTCNDSGVNEVPKEQVENLFTKYTTLPLTSAAHYGLATGLLLALAFNSRLPIKFKSEFRASKYQQWIEAFIIRVTFAAACLLLAVTVTPLVTITLLLLAFYRQLVHRLLSLTNSSFAGLLEGTDAVWALEEDNSKSIINVLAMFEVEIIDNNFKPQLMTMLRKLVQTRILTTPESCPKFWQYRRRSRLGYFYWERQEEVRVEDHIQYMTQEDDVVNQQDPDSSDEECYREDYYGMSESVLKCLVSALANSPLPGENASSWEILVGRDPILENLPSTDLFDAMEEGIPDSSMRCRRYPVLFRVHHSMGDGVALIKLLLEALADKKNIPKTHEGIITTTIVEDFPTKGFEHLSRQAPLIENICLVSCSTGDQSTPEICSPMLGEITSDKVKETEENYNKIDIGNVRIEAPDIVCHVNRIPIAIAVRCPSQEFDELFYDEGPSLYSETLKTDIFSIDCNQSHTRAKRYPALESYVTIEDDILTSPVLGPKGKTIYFYKEKEVLDDDYEKLRCYSPPIPIDRSPFLRDDSLPTCKSPILEDNFLPRCVSPLPKILLDELPPRCRSPLPFVLDDSPPRCQSPLQKLLREDSPPRCISPLPPFKREDSVEQSCGSPVHTIIPETHRCQSPFLKDNFPATYKPLRVTRTDTPMPLDSPVLRSYTPINNFTRTESPVPQIHRKQYSHLWNDTPTSSGNNSPTPGGTPKCSSPLFRNNFPHPQSEINSSRCDSPFQRYNTPLPRNDHPIPRCNSPFQRSSTLLPLNDNLIPRCKSPFLRGSTPLLLDNPSQLRSISPIPRNRTPLPERDSPIPRNHSPILMNNTQMPPYSVESNNNIHQRLFATNDSKEGSCKSGIIADTSPLSVDTQEISEFYVKGNEFQPDAELINNKSTSSNRFLRLLVSINHRPSMFVETFNYIKDTVGLVFAPATLINQTLIRSADVNPLHGIPLSGDKVLAWYFDPKDDENLNLLNMIKRIKSRMSDAKFSDIFLSALSSSLENYFIGVGCDDKNIPETVTVVVPARMATEEDIKYANNRKISEIKENDVSKLPAMENRFSVALLSLPITSISNTRAKQYSSIGRLREVCKHMEFLRKSPDYQINYWLMRVVSTFLPLRLLAPVLNSTQSTMVVSNLFGPPEKLELGGYKLKDLVFWVPNRGSTGVGVSVLSYAGRLQIGIVADQALIPTQEDADTILNGIIYELQQLDDFTVPVITQTKTL